MKSTVKSYFFITLGTILVVLGVYFFEFANNFSTGGVSGTSVILSKLTGNISPARIATILNFFLLLLGYLVLGKGFALKTVYSTLLYSILYNLIPILPSSIVCIALMSALRPALSRLEKLK